MSERYGGYSYNYSGSEAYADDHMYSSTSPQIGSTYASSNYTFSPGVAYAAGAYRPSTPRTSPELSYERTYYPPQTADSSIYQIFPTASRRSRQSGSSSRGYENLEHQFTADDVPSHSLYGRFALGESPGSHVAHARGAIDDFSRGSGESSASSRLPAYSYPQELVISDDEDEGASHAAGASQGAGYYDEEYAPSSQSQYPSSSGSRSYQASSGSSSHRSGRRSGRREENEGKRKKSSRK